MIILGLGSNLGDRRQNIQQALELMESCGKINVQQSSHLYETSPFGVIHQPDFLNLVVSVETTLSPEDLLKECLAIEQLLGRVRTARWGPRTIDIDLLCYHNIARCSPELVLPHPGVPERSFVLIPLSDIAADLIWTNGKSVREMVAEHVRMNPNDVKLWQKVQWDPHRRVLIESKS